MKLKTALFFARMGRIGSIIGIIFTVVSLLLMYNIGMDTTSGLLGMAFYLVNYYVYTALTEHVQDRIKEGEKK